MTIKSRNPGQLRHRVRVQFGTEGPDGKGGSVTTWATAGHRWADLVPRAGKLVQQGQQQEGQTIFDVVMRLFPGLGFQHRLVFQGRVLRMTKITNEEEQSFWHVLECVESPDTIGSEAAGFDPSLDLSLCPNSCYVPAVF